MIDLVAAIVSHTPPWVWLLLAAIVALGVRQMRRQRVGATRVLLLPAVLGLLGLGAAWRTFGAAGPIETALAWALGAAIGIAASRALAPLRGIVAHADGSLEVPGSVVPLALMLGVFALRYVVNVALAMHPALAAPGAFAITACAAYGAAGGLFAARAHRLWVARMPARVATAA
jgi:hypothetical protein